jgi:truncated hemoglobin YjbI
MTSNKSNDVSGSCCPFEPNKGFSTLESRQEYLKVHHHEKAAENDVDLISESLHADMDTSQPLYFWQLYSIIGKEPILAFIAEFYNRIYADTKEEWFLVAFTGIGDKAHHIKSQSSYWIDALGGGRVYFGGKSRVNFHHYSNHAEHIMNERGAKRWMHHMRGAIRSYDFSKFNDPRIVPALVEFLRVKVITHAEEHQWEFNDSDFAVIDFDFQQKNKKVATPSAVSSQ